MAATLHVIFGPCGAGKTTYAHALDDWGARLFGPDVTQPLDFGWILERAGRCAEQLRSTATAVVAAGASVVLDMGLMRRADRERIRQSAEATGVPLQWHFVDAPHEVRRARVAGRNTVKGDTFAMEVTPEMFDLIESIYEPPGPTELQGAVISVSG